MSLNIGLFKRPYTVRQFQPQENINGHYVAAFTDTTMRLNVQPLTPDELNALSEGERTVRRLKTFGKTQLKSADDFSGIPGDRLYYGGLWYECVSSNMWDHTPLSHYESKFVLIPFSEQGEPPKPPGAPDAEKPQLADTETL